MKLMCYFMVKYSEQELNEEKKQVYSGEVAKLMEAYKKRWKITISMCTRGILLTYSGAEK